VLPDIDYPFADKIINISVVFAGQKKGVTQVDDKIWLVSFI